MDKSVEGRAASLFRANDFKEAQRCYSSCLAALSPVGQEECRVNLLFNRSACFMKLKQFEKVVEDCSQILSIDCHNEKAYSRQVKALCNIKDFVGAYKTTTTWLQYDPQNARAKREFERLGIVINALDDQECDDDNDDVLVGGPELEGRVPPEGKEDDANTQSPGTQNTLNTNSPLKSATPGSSKLNTTSVANNLNLKDNKMRTIISKNLSPHVEATNNLKSLTDTTQCKAPGNLDTGRYDCKYCKVSCDSQAKLREHVSTEEHKKKVSCDDDRVWKYRPPPRGVTSDEYMTCISFYSTKMCKLGEKCSQAHSDSELKEWKERFEYRKEKMEAAKQLEFGEASYVEKLYNKWLESPNPTEVMTDALEGVHVHVNTDLVVTTSSKRFNNSWTFTVTSRQSVHKVALLDDTNRSYFSIASVTVGPKKSQRAQKVSENCQEWTNHTFSPGKNNNEQVFRIKIMFKTIIYGTFRQTVVLDFGSEPVLVNHICVDSTPVTDLDKLHDDLIINQAARWDTHNSHIVQFEPWHGYSDQERNILDLYPPPMAAKFIMSEALTDGQLRKENYRSRMHDLLSIEEMAQFSSIARFNVKTTIQLVDRFMLAPSNVSTAKYAQGGELFARMKLVSDVSEDTSHGRLILQNVNTVLLAPVNQSNAGKSRQKVYEAMVEEKGKNFIFIRLSAKTVEELKLQTDTEFTTQVQFQLNRMPICEMHYAIGRLPDSTYVFPDVQVIPKIPWTPNRQWDDTLDSRLNAKQKEAIVAITTKLSSKLPPVLIVGPYGTGKTFTLAQAALQILNQSGSRVLICTHSNSAADLYIKDYFHPYIEKGHKEAKPLRIVFKGRWIQTVHQTILDYCTLEGSTFRMPTMEELNDHRIIVTTLSTSRCLDDLGLDPGFFTHILIDEAAQAMECEAIMPLALANHDTRLVLAGDHMQLSPEVHSDFARERDFHISLLERLYDIYPAENPCKILLCENYRSHEAIISCTSDLFYDNRLVASGNQPRHEVFYPLTFFMAKGEDNQHNNSTAFYNTAEVYEIVERVDELQKMWPKSWGPLDESSIGVVSPYTDQVIRIRAELRKRKLFRVNVERVLNVQGKQFRVIFLSTVRTRATCSSDPEVENLLDYGFLSNMKLLNTAITRAQSLVAVVGDAVSLCSIGKCRKLWEYFIDIAQQNNSLFGITWTQIRASLDGVELKKTYVLNPNAPEFVPNRLRHGPDFPVVVPRPGHPYINSPAYMSAQPHYTWYMPRPPIYNPSMYYGYMSPYMQGYPYFTAPTTSPRNSQSSKSNKKSLSVSQVSPKIAKSSSPAASLPGAQATPVGPGTPNYTVVSVSRPSCGTSTTTGTPPKHHSPVPAWQHGAGVPYQHRFPGTLQQMQPPVMLGFPPNPMLIPHPQLAYHPSLGAAQPMLYPPFLGPGPFVVPSPQGQAPTAAPSPTGMPPVSTTPAPRATTSPISISQGTRTTDKSEQQQAASPQSPMHPGFRIRPMLQGEAMRPTMANSHPHIQLLPNVKHIPPHLASHSKSMPPNHQPRSMVPGRQASVRLPTYQQGHHPLLPNVDDRVLITSPHLQREFYMYILNTEGKVAADSFIEYIQEQTKIAASQAHLGAPLTIHPSPHPGGQPYPQIQSQAPPVNNTLTNKASSPDTKGVQQQKSLKKEVVSVAVTLDEASSSRSSPLSLCSTDDLSDQSFRSSERTRDLRSPTGGATGGIAGAMCGGNFEESAIEHIVKSMDHLVDESKENELGNIHIAQNIMKVAFSGQSAPQRNTPLYMRGGNVGTPGSDMEKKTESGPLSYAGALRKQTTPPATSTSPHLSQPTHRSMDHNKVTQNPMVQYASMIENHRQNNVLNNHSAPETAYHTSANQFGAHSNNAETSSGVQQNHASSSAAFEAFLQQTKSIPSQGGLLGPNTDNDLYRGLLQPITPQGRPDQTQIPPNNLNLNLEDVISDDATSAFQPPVLLPTTPDQEQDPLELLRHLNIKASPGTEALYQYFS
ncbi:unnamed protein product [Owenia fusiformis]|uniref:Uncharacterized protein n=1 Tax=Owenia fusiformis TaxID=6347 RepID=A0A8J1U4D4_OWEFU|nr:unnamed protein product [Owenia fusiformis]